MGGGEVEKMNKTRISWKQNMRQIMINFDITTEDATDRDLWRNIMSGKSTILILTRENSFFSEENPL